AADDPVITMVGRLDLEKYKATIKGLTQFGDRLQGTDRNKAANDWIAAQLKSYGCAPERFSYVFMPAATTAPAAAEPQQSPVPREIASGQIVNGVGGSRLRGITSPTTGVGPNSSNLDAQPDPALRKLNTQVVPPGPRDEVYCTKIGAVHPGEMY